MNQPVRVLIVDDSAVVRGLMVSALANTPEIEVVGTAMHGEAALRQLRTRAVDVVILDVEMPVMDGLTALPHILDEFPRTRVVMASATTIDGAEHTVQALALGAVACIAKPVAQSVSDAIAKLTAELIPIVKALGRAHGIDPVPLPALPTECRIPLYRGVPEVIVIGSSTGGPNALSQLVSRLPAEVTCPILIVQHMPPLFTPVLAKHLEKDSGRPTFEAAEGSVIESGCIYVAPGDFHLVIERINNRLVTTVNQEPPQHYVRPSVNPLFYSAAKFYGIRALAVMLTGMGDDGIEGTREIVRCGGSVIAQDEATSVVWGMPGAVVRAGLADQILPLNSIADALARHFTRELVLR